MFLSLCSLVCTRTNIPEERAATIFTGKILQVQMLVPIYQTVQYDIPKDHYSHAN